MLCAKCGKEPIIRDLMIGQNCLEALQKNPASLVRERALPVEAKTKPRKPTDGGRSLSSREEKELAASAGNYGAAT